MHPMKRVLIGLMAGSCLTIVRVFRGYFVDMPLDWAFFQGMLIIAVPFVVIGAISGYISKENARPKLFKECLLAPGLVFALIAPPGGDTAKASDPSGNITRMESELYTATETKASPLEFFIPAAHAQPQPPPRPRGQTEVQQIKKEDFEASGFDRALQFIGISRRPNNWVYLIDSTADSSLAVAKAEQINRFLPADATPAKIIHPEGSNKFYLTAGQFQPLQTAVFNQQRQQSFILPDTGAADTLGTADSLHQAAELFRQGRAVNVLELFPKR